MKVLQSTSRSSWGLEECGEEQPKRGRVEIIEQGFEDTQSRAIKATPSKQQILLLLPTTRCTA